MVNEQELSLVHEDVAAATSDDDDNDGLILKRGMEVLNIIRLIFVLLHSNLTFPSHRRFVYFLCERTKICWFYL